jgi:hypothetical protein
MIAEFNQGIFFLEVHFTGIGQENRKLELTYITLLMVNMVIFRMVCFVLRMFVVVFKFYD